MHGKTTKKYITLLKKYTYRSKADSIRNVNRDVRMLTSRSIQQTTLRPCTPDTALCRSAFCPHYKSYHIYRFSLSPPCPDVSIHFRTDTQKPASILSRTLTAGRSTSHAGPFPFIANSRLFSNGKLGGPRNSVYFTDGRNSTKPSTTTEVCHEVTP
jgi:hypothetical protein